MDELSVTFDWANRDIISIVGGILLGILILVVGRWLVHWLSRLAGRFMLEANTDETVVRFLQKLITAGLFVVVVISALDIAGVQTSGLTALLAAAGLSVGLALKDSLSNFASGILILVQKPYQVDDLVEVAGVSGSVEEVSIFSTRLRASDNVSVIVPNSSVTKNNIHNYSANDLRRIDLVASIGYEDNIGEARDILMAIMVAHALVLEEPAPSVDVLDLANSSVNLTVRPWVNIEHYARVRADMLEQIKLRFDDAGIGAR